MKPGPARIHSEIRFGLELAALARSRTWRAPERLGDDGPVLLVPGFLAGDETLRLLSMFLKRSGWTPRRSGIATNIDCSERTMARLEQRLERICAEHGRPAAWVGHSRGGMLGRVMLVRRPDLVSTLVTLGSPLQASREKLSGLLTRQIDLLLAAGGRGVPGLIGPSCRKGGPNELDADGTGCCERFWEELAAPLPAGRPVVCVRSRADGVVRFEAARDADPRAASVEVPSTHVGMAANPLVFAAVATALAAPGSELAAAA